jgi:hypothetical protein
MRFIRLLLLDMSLTASTGITRIYASIYRQKEVGCPLDFPNIKFHQPNIVITND